MKFAAILAAVALAAGMAGAAPRQVTHEDIRDAILSFVQMFKDLTDKLERHEYRERHLGEQLKKALSTIDKRERSQDALLTNTGGVLSKILDAVQKLEVAVNSNKQQRDSYQIDMVPLQSWMTNVEGILQQNQNNGNYVEKEEMQQMEASVSAKLDALTTAVERLDAKLSQNGLGEELGKLQDQIDSQLSSQKHWQNNVQSALEDHRAKMEQAEEASRRDLESKIAQGMLVLKNEILSSFDEESSKLENRLTDISESMNKVNTAVVESISEGNELATGFHDIVHKMFDQLLNEVKALSKVEKVLVQTADNVMDTKRRIEYGVQQILVEVGDSIRLQGKELNHTMSSRFDLISGRILENQEGGLKNLSNKIETEISQVWRQIGIMYQQLTASAGALDKLQEQTETYVNGSLQTMDGIEGKVGQITGRMSEVDDNLNFLLGRLSLVTQEFDQIKTALTSALDKIRTSLNTVQDKIKETGPGPNPIDSSLSPSNENLI